MFATFGYHGISAVSVLWTSSVIYLVTPLLLLVKTPADMNELRDLHSSALILIASKIIMAMLAIRRGFRTLVLHSMLYTHTQSTVILCLVMYDIVCILVTYRSLISLHSGCRDQRKWMPSSELHTVRQPYLIAPLIQK